MLANEVRAALQTTPPAVGHSCSWGEAGRRHIYQTKWLTPCQDEDVEGTFRSFRFAFMWFPNDFRGRMWLSCATVHPSSPRHSFPFASKHFQHLIKCQLETPPSIGRGRRRPHRRRPIWLPRPGPAFT